MRSQNITLRGRRSAVVSDEPRLPVGLLAGRTMTERDHWPTGLQAQRRDRHQQPATMADRRNAKFLKIFGGEMMHKSLLTSFSRNAAS